MYQVTWTRLLVLHVGSTTVAIATVVAAFMGGLAVGAALGADLSTRIDAARALAAYAALEIGAAAAAIVLPFALRLSQPLLAWAYADDGSALLFSVARTATCLFVVAVPAVLLGATFPLVVRGASADSEPQASAGRLYAVNTAGAAAGALAAGFLLLPKVGLRLTVATGAAASVAAAAAALLARSLVWESVGTRSTPKPARAAARVPSHATDSADETDIMAAIVVVAATGFAGLLYEVAWTRAVASLLGPTTYAFAGVVFTLIAGLAIGSGIGASVMVRRFKAHTALSATLGATGLIVWWGNIAVGTRIPSALARAFADASGKLAWPLLVRMGATLVPLLPAAIGLGIAFPIALRLAGSANANRRIGWLYAINTAAGVLGTFASAPLLVRIGLEGTLQLVPVILLIAASASIAFGCRFRQLAPTIAAAVLLALALSLARTGSVWDRELLASGIYKYARTIPAGLDLESVLKAATLVDYRDGEHATVAVTRFAGTTSLVVDGKVDGSTGGDMLTQELVAHLPLLLHEHPRDVLVVGLGTGVTAAAAAVHPAERIDVVEISPEIVRASSYFRQQNRDVLSDPRVHLIVGDGRSQLRLGRRKYDVIISEPSNPWVAGMAALFTRETFAAIRSRLAPGGTVCQWLHTYDISERDLRSIVATFGDVFPNATLWMIGDGDLLLAASDGPLDSRLPNIARAWTRPGVAADLARLGMTQPFGLLSLWAGGPRMIAELAHGAELQRDDRMALEFSGPSAVYRASGSNQVLLLRRLSASADVPDTIARARATANAAAWRDRGAMLQKIHVFDEAYGDYVKALELDPADGVTLSQLAEVSIQAGQTADALARLDARVKAAPSSAPARVALSKLLASVGRQQDAVAVARAAADQDGAATSVIEQLAALYADAGDLVHLQQTVDKLQALAPNTARTRYFAATARFMQGAYADALRDVTMSLERSPDDVDALNLQGDALASLGRFDDAERVFQAALARAPADPTIFVNLGQVALAKGDAAGAARHFTAALTLSPTFAPARENLARAQMLLARR